MAQQHNGRIFLTESEVETLLAFPPDEIPELRAARTFYYCGMVESGQASTKSGSSLVYAEGFFFSEMDDLEWSSLSPVELASPFEPIPAAWPCSAMIDHQQLSARLLSDALSEGQSLSISSGVYGPVFYPEDLVHEAINRLGIPLKTRSTAEGGSTTDSQRNRNWPLITGALLALLTKDGKWNQTRIIADLEALEIRGLRKRTLEDAFAVATRAFSEKAKE